MNFDSSLETFALVSIRRIMCRINDGDVKIVGYFILRNYVAQAFRGLWTLVVETPGEIVGDRRAVGFFFHLVGFILFVRYCCKYVNIRKNILHKSRALFWEWEVFGQILLICKESFIEKLCCDVSKNLYFFLIFYIFTYFCNFR